MDEQTVHGTRPKVSTAPAPIFLAKKKRKYVHLLIRANPKSKLRCHRRETPKLVSKLITQQLFGT